MTSRTSRSAPASKKAEKAARATSKSKAPVTALKTQRKAPEKKQPASRKKAPIAWNEQPPRYHHSWSDHYSMQERMELAVAEDGMTPLQFFQSVINDPDASVYAKMEAARSAAPYVHKKQPTAIELPPQKRTNPIMRVPLVASMAEWEKIAQESQSKLKEQVRK